MNRQIMSVTGGIIFFVILYILISYSFYKEAVLISEGHMIKQTRISLREVSNRMDSFLSERAASLKVLPLFSEIRNCISTGNYTFMHKTSLMSLDDSEIFAILDKNGRCVMVEPTKYSSILLNTEFAAGYSEILKKKKMSELVSRAVPVKAEKSGGSYFVFVFAAISNPDNSYDGAFCLGFKVEKLFHDYFKPLEANYEGSMACITDEEGNVEVFKNNEVVMKNAVQLRPSLLPPIPRKLKDEEYHGYHVWKTPDGKRYLIIYHPIDVGTHKWIAQFRIPYAIIDQALEPFYWKQLYLLVILVLTSFIGIFITIMTGKQILQLRKRISALEIQIDHEKKKAAVEGIVSSDYFRSLQEQAKILKNIGEKK